MSVLQKRLVHNYSILVMGKRYILKEEDRVNDHQKLVPSTEWKLSDGTVTTLNEEVEMEVAKREIEIFEKLQ